MNMNYRFLIVLSFAAMFLFPAFSNAQNQGMGDRPGIVSPNDVAKDIQTYNDQRKELGKALFYNFNEMYKESFPKLKELTQQENPVAAYYYAECLYNGWGTFPPDIPKAKAIWAQVIDKIRAMTRDGDGLVSYTMYQVYNNGYAVPKDDQRARRFLEYSINKGYGLAIFDKARRQEEEGLYADAIATYLEAAKKDNPEANFRLGYIYETGERGLQQDYKLALTYYSNAAAYGHIKAQANLGNLYYNGLGTEQNYQEALSLFQKAAEKENPAAMNNLGVMYLKGEGGLREDSKIALVYFMKASHLGDENAHNNLGNMYFNGIGVKEDRTKAFYYYHLAAAKKNPEAMYKVAYMLENGIGVQANKNRADAWYKALEKEGYEISDFQ